MMTKIKHALTFMWGILLGMSLVQVHFAPASLDGGKTITNGWSFASWILIVFSCVAMFALVLMFFVEHWEDK